MTAYNDLPTLVRRKFEAARACNDLNFYETEVSILSCNGLPFQVRYSPSLANKPKSNKSKDLNAKPFNPFLNPAEGLLISGLISHNLVLNKFPVIPDHFILATKDFKEQTHLLEEEDLFTAYSCLKAYRDNGEELFGFFNSGGNSGASQPHRHIQFLPVESMRSGVKDGQRWNVLADSLLKNPGLPFAYFVSDIPADPSSVQLHEIYIRLYQQACHAVVGSGSPLSAENGESRISYNLGLTDRAMVVCPRVSEGIKIKSDKGELIGPVSLNGTVLGGTLLVKSEAEWNALRNDGTKLEEVLKSIGISPTILSTNERL